MREHRRRPARVVTTVMTTTAATVAAVALSSTASAVAGTPAAAAKTTTSTHVIVLLKNQFSGLQTRRAGSASARTRAIVSSQAPVIDAARSAGAHNVTAYHLINGFAATVTPSAAAALSRNPSVKAIVPDLPIKTAPIVEQDLASGKMRAAVSGPASSSYCSSDQNNPLLEPEALQTMKVDYNDPSKPSASDIADGSGVTVGYIADGVDINNPDFQRGGHSVFTDYKDFSGDGLNAPSPAAESFGDASAIAAQGNQVYDVNTFSPSVNQPNGCYIKIRGVAPGADVVGLKVFGNSNTAPTSHFISAIQYAVNTDHVDVLNESFGGNPYPDTNDDPISLADNAAIAAGTTVVSSTGDAGVTGTTGSPATSSGVIAAAATTIYRSVEQVKLDGLTNPALGVTGWANDNISSLSSGGFAQNGKVPDVAAPGESGWALCSADTTTYEECTNEIGDPTNFQLFGGTSQSSPLTAGVAALVIQAYEQAHGGAKPSPSLVKSILVGTAQDLNHTADQQGAGEVDALAAVQAAQSVPAEGSSATPADATGNSLITRTAKAGVDQLDLSGATHKTVAGSFTVQNASPSTQKVSLHSRSLTKTLSNTGGSLTLDPNQTFPNVTGSARAYKIVKFKVPVGADRLTARIAFDSSDNGGYTVFGALVDPFGTFQSYSEPQGLANYGWMAARNPAPGTWKMMIWANPAFTAPIQYGLTTEKYTNYGTVRPSSVTLAPGQSAKITASYPLGGNAGDRAAAVVMSSTLGASSTLPVSLRTLIPSGAASNTFSGALTGGNGRASSPGDQQSFWVNVPKNKPNLAMRIALQGQMNPNEVVLGFFVDPNGHVQSANTNVIIDKRDPERRPDGRQPRRQAHGGALAVPVGAAEPGRRTGREPAVHRDAELPGVLGQREAADAVDQVGEGQDLQVHGHRSQPHQPAAELRCRPAAHPHGDVQAGLADPGPRLAAPVAAVARGDAAVAGAERQLVHQLLRQRDDADRVGHLLGVRRPGGVRCTERQLGLGDPDLRQHRQRLLQRRHRRARPVHRPGAHGHRVGECHGAHARVRPERGQFAG